MNNLYSINVINSNFNIYYNSNNIIKYFSNSNNNIAILYGDQYANNFYFNSNFNGFNFNNNNINYNALNHTFNGNVNIKGNLINAIFPSNVVLLNNNNQIDKTFIPTNNNYAFFKSGRNVGIGTSNPLTKLHLYNGDITVSYGRIGINTIPAYTIHLNETQEVLPSLVLSSNNIINFIAYANKQAIGIGTNNITDPSISIYSSGKIFTTNLEINKNNIKLFYYDNYNNLIINTPICISSIYSSNNQININNDINLKNISVYDSLIYNSNLNLICNPFNNLLNFNDYVNIGINNSNFIIKNLFNDNNGFIYNNDSIYINNIYASNLNVANNTFNSLNINGNLNLYNETSKYPINIYCNDLNKLFFITNNNTFYYYNEYDLNPTIILNDIIPTNIISKFDKIAYYNENTYNIYYYSNNSWNSIQNNSIVINYSFDNNTFYYISNNNDLYFQGRNVNIQTLNYNDITTIFNFTKIFYNNIKFKYVECGDDFVVIVDTNNLIYTFGKNNINQLGRDTNYLYDYINKITINNFNNVLQVTCGTSHSLILYNDGLVYSFGDTINNSTYKKGYTTNTIYPTLLNIDEKIIKIKASYNNSILLSNNFNVYICGNINTFYNLYPIYLITNIPKIIDISCGFNNCSLLTNTNSIFTFNNLNNDNSGIARINNNTNTIPKIITLPIDFYGISIKSKGTIIIGNSYFNLNNVANNSLIVENFIGIGTTLNYDNNNNYSFVVSGNINVINGNIYKNGILFTGNSGNYNTFSFWNNNTSNIFYNNGFVGIGTNNPKKTLEVIGDISLTGNIYINNTLLSSKLISWDNSSNSIFYNKISSKVGINTNNPLFGFNIYDTTFSINNIIYNSNLLLLDSISSNIIFNNNINDVFYNPIAISGDGNTIITSFYKNINTIFNNNSVFVYKNNNNIWNKHIIYSPVKNISFGNDIKLSYDGSTIIIGCYDDYDIINSARVNNGSFYLYKNNDYNNCNIIKYLPNFGIARKFAISYDGSIIASFIHNNYYNIFINKNLNSYLLDFNSYNFHYSFENCSIDINNNGSIIIASFNNNVNYTNFLYNNIYIIHDNDIRFIYLNSLNTNYTINKVSISGDGNKLLLSVTDNRTNIINYDIAYLYILDDSLLIDNVYNIKIPNYIFKLPYNNHFISKISKDGNFIYSIPSGNSINKTFSYKYNNIDDIWLFNEILLNYNLNIINNYYFDLSYNGFFNVLSILSNYINDNYSVSDILLFNFYYNKTLLYTNNGALTFGSNIFNHNYDTSFYGSTFINSLNTDFLYADGLNINNIQLNNISTSNYINSIFFNNSNSISFSSNLVWDNDLNILTINGDIICSNLNTNVDLSKIKNNSILSLKYGGLGVSNINFGQIPFGFSSSNMNVSSNFLWIDYTSNLIINGTINAIHNYANFFYGNGYNITNINLNNVYGLLDHAKGGLGINNIPTGNILYGNNFNSIATSKKLVWDIYNSNLNVSGNIIASNIYSHYLFGDGTNISNLTATNINGILNIINGGTGLNNINNAQLMVGNGNNILTTSNLIWDNRTCNLIICGSLYSCNIIGDGSCITNINANNINGKITITNGGIGDLFINAGNFIIGANNYTITSSPALYLTNNHLYMYGNLYSSNIYSHFIGDGSKITNISITNLSGNIPIQNGGTGLNVIGAGQILIGNGYNPIITTTDFKYDLVSKTLLLVNITVTGTLTVANFVCTSKFVINNNIKEVINVANGGTGSSSIPLGNILIGNNNSSLLYSSNLYWNNTTSNLIVTGSINSINNIANYFIGDGSLISNIVSSNIAGIININNGGLGVSNIASGTLLIGNDNNSIITSSNLLWNNFTSNLIVNGSITTNSILANYFIGDATFTSNIIASNIKGIINVNNGGLGVSNIASGTLLFGNNNNNIITSSNLLWNNFTSNLIINGSITTNSILANYFIGDATFTSNIIASNIKGIVGITNGGLGINNIPIGQLLFGGVNNIGTSPNISWNNSATIFNVNGSINTNSITTNTINANGSNIIGVNLSNITGVLYTSNGGTGLNNIPTGNVLIGNGTNNIYTTSNLLWFNNKLGINYINNNPNYSLDINGDINFTGNIFNNSLPYVSPSGWSNISTFNSIYSMSNVLIGYNTPDPNFMLKVYGNIYASGDITALSDEKFKYNISPIDNALNKVEKLSGVYFNRNDINNDKRYIGLIAQDVEKIIPEVITNSDLTGKSIAYGNLVGLLIEAIKELSEKIKKLENK